MIIRSSNGRKRAIKDPKQITAQTDCEINEGDAIYRTINDKSQLLSLKPGYIMSPCAQKIFNNNFVAYNLQIMHESSKVRWNGIVDLRKLQAPLSYLIDLGKTSIQIYPDEHNKPVQGTELNRSCLATFGDLKKINKQELLKICMMNGLQLIAVDEQRKLFTVQIPHFTLYSFVEDEEQEEKRKKLLKLQQVESSTQSQENKQFEDPNAVICELSPQQQFQDIMKMSQNEESIINFLLDKYESFEVQRFISLYVILFRPEICNFQFVDMNQLDHEGDDQNDSNQVVSSLESLTHSKVMPISNDGPVSKKIRIKKRKHEKKLQKHQQIKYLKDWIEWVIHHYKDILETDNQIYRSLAMRNYNHLIRRFIEQQKFENAEFLACIEDEFYMMNTGYPKEICEQLKSIALRDNSVFQNQHWIFQLGVYLWYYCFGQQNQKKILNKILSKTSYGPDCLIQKYLLRIFFNLPPEGNQQKMLPFQFNGNQSKILPWWWMICNQITKQQQQYFDISQLDYGYQSYRFDMMKRMLSIYRNSEITYRIMKKQTILSVWEQKQLVKEFSKGNLQILRGFLNLNNDIITEEDVCEVQGYQMYSAGKYLSALKLFAESTFNYHNKSTLLTTIVTIIQCEEMVCSFHIPTCRKVCGYLENILKNLGINKQKMSQKLNQQCRIMFQQDNNDILLTEITQIDKLISCYLYLRTKLGYQPMDWQTFINVYNFAKNTYIHHRMQYDIIMDCCFEVLLQNPFTSQLFKDNEKAYEILLNIYRKDPSKILQLRLVRISR